MVSAHQNSKSNSNVDHLSYDSQVTTRNSSVNSLNNRKISNTNNESNNFNNSILVAGNSVDDILNDFSEIIGSSDNYNIEDDYYESFTKHKPKPTIYLNEFAVHIPAGEEMADAVARNHGFSNLGQVRFIFFLILTGVFWGIMKNIGSNGAALVSLGLGLGLRFGDILSADYIPLADQTTVVGMNFRSIKGRQAK